MTFVFDALAKLSILIKTKINTLACANPHKIRIMPKNLAFFIAVFESITFPDPITVGRFSMFISSIVLIFYHKRINLCTMQRFCGF